MPGFRIEGNEENSLPPPDPDVKRAHRWRIEKFGAVDNLPILPSPDELLLAKSVTMPTFGFEEQSVLGGSIPYKFATKPAFSDLVVAFYDLIGLEPMIRKWQEAVWKPAQGIGQADRYKDEVIVYLVDGQGSPVDDAWVFVNAWPKIINHGELTYDSSDFKLLTVTVSYDFIEFRPPGSETIRAGAEAEQMAANNSFPLGVSNRAIVGNRLNEVPT
jgi:hypothetical protein